MQVPRQNFGYFSLGAISVHNQLLGKLDSCNILASLCFLLQALSLHLLDFVGTKGTFCLASQKKKVLIQKSRQKGLKKLIKIHMLG
jgi:hypothetical protein